MVRLVVVLLVTIVGASPTDTRRVRTAIHRDSQGYYQLDISTWLVATNTDSVVWRDYLADRVEVASVVVLALTRGWATHRSSDLADWLRDASRFF